MGKEHFFTVDIGASKVRVALGDKRGVLLEKITFPTPQDDREGISRKLIEVIHSLKSRHAEPFEVEGIGIGSIGPIDAERGVITYTPNLRIKNIPVVKPLKEEFDIPIVFLNDCVAAVLGEKFFGAGKEARNIVYVTMSTGIGGGVFVDGRLIVGKDGNAGEIGHFIVDSGRNLRCGCGGYGHWEAYCSGSNIPRFIRILLQEYAQDLARESYIMRVCDGDLGKVTAKTLYNGVKSRDALSLKILDEINDFNARGFANVINAYDPELITIGGAIAINNADEVLEPIKRGLKRYVTNRIPDIMVTPLKEDATLYGGLASIIYKSIYSN